MIVLCLKLLRICTNLHLQKHRVILIHIFLIQQMFHSVLSAKFPITFFHPVLEICNVIVQNIGPKPWNDIPLEIKNFFRKFKQLFKKHSIEKHKRD